MADLEAVLDAAGLTNPQVREFVKEYAELTGAEHVEVVNASDDARLVFGPLSLARTRRWVKEGSFDVLHVHEPTVPSVSMLACFAASGPIVATFHTATARSRALQVFGTALQPALEKVIGRYEHFRAEAVTTCAALHLDSADLTFTDLTRLIIGYMES